MYTRGARRVAVTLTLAGVFATRAMAAAPPPSDVDVLLTAIDRINLIQRVTPQADEMLRTMDAEAAAQVRAQIASWADQRRALIREDLVDRFGDQAETRLRGFVDEFTKAEQQKDADFLSLVAEQLNIPSPVPASYAELHRWVLGNRLVGDMTAISDLMGEVETWVDVNKRSEKPITLAAWLQRDTPAAPASHAAKPPKRAAPAKPVNPLAAAEAGPGDVEDEDLDAGFTSPLDTVTQLHRDRRSQVLLDAQAGMAQVATEREAAEQEYAARKTALAQADAEAMKKQAEKYAAVEAEALEQRKNSWGNRFKKILGSTVAAGVGAFTGGIGTEVAQRAVNEIFK